MKWQAFTLALYFLVVSHAYAFDIPSDYKAFYQEIAVEMNVPAQWLHAITKIESDFRPWAVNIGGNSFYFHDKASAMAAAQEALDKGKSFDVGLMQVNSYWLRKYQIPIDTALEPKENIRLGAGILKQEIERLGLNSRAIGAYHSPDRLKAVNYANKVMKLLNEPIQVLAQNDKSKLSAMAVISMGKPVIGNDLRVDIANSAMKVKAYEKNY